MIGTERELRAIRREIVLQSSAELKGRGIEVARRQVAHRAAGNVGEKNMRALAVFPLRPMAVEQRIGHVGVERAFAPALFDLLVASIVGAAFGIDVARERDPFPIRRPERIANSRGNIGELSGFATAGGDDVKIVVVTAIARTDEGDRFAVRRKAGRRFAFFAKCELARVLAVGIHQPDVAGALGLGEVVRVQGVKNGLAVGRYVQGVNSANAIKIFDGEGAFCSGAGDRQQHKTK